MKARVIAFYLPQYHPTPDNDKWWGKGFTEWTNVGKAKPLFRGHYQPHVPADLGYYDLRLPEVRAAQAEMARQAGVYGFCYYHYWFGNGKEELELPFDEVVKSGQPDFPFCLCWANESWHAKFWNPDGEVSRKTTLVEQTYPGKEDHIRHFYRLLPAFKDPRYIKVDGKILFMIYRPLEFPEVDEFMQLWQSLAVENGLEGFFFCGYANGSYDLRKMSGLGLDAVTLSHLKDCFQQTSSARKLLREGSFLRKMLGRMRRYLVPKPTIIAYDKALRYLAGEEEKDGHIFPTLIPNWDHTPRSGTGGHVLTNSTPELFGQHVERIIETVRHKEESRRIVFLKSWNEWGEGNYVEPDLKYGHGYLDVLRKNLG